MRRSRRTSSGESEIRSLISTSRCVAFLMGRAEYSLARSQLSRVQLPGGARRRRLKRFPYWTIRVSVMVRANPWEVAVTTTG